MCLSKEALIVIGNYMDNSKEISYETYDLINRKIYSEFGAEECCKILNIMYDVDYDIKEVEELYKEW